MESFDLILNKLDSTLQRYNLVNYEKLESSLPTNETEFYLNKLNITDSDFRSLYYWKNGYNVNKNVNNICSVLEYGTFMSLESVYNTFLKNKTGSGRWDSPSLIPFITDSTGQYILFNNRNGANYGKLYLYSASILVAIDTISYYDSISSLLQTTIEAYEKGILKYIETEDWLDIDVRKFRDIAVKYNFNSKFWKHKN